MTLKEKNEILEKAKLWFKKSIAENHIKNTKKLSNIKEFNINPFLLTYLSNFLEGNHSAKSIAKALIYPRALGTSINTSFGTQIQKFTSEVLASYASTTSGIDIEFIDQIDNEKKYCQLKSGPNTINKDDVETIAQHFTNVINLGRTNGLKLGFHNLIVGVIYGEYGELSSHYKRINLQYHYEIIIGEDFWYRLTGDKDFYSDLIKAVGEVAIDANFKQELEEVIIKLSKNKYIQELTKELNS
ncbi:restriction endonuclease [Halarcobacter ebronensis]|uniref:Restriction endonuclease n=1 Tax=Halarcobacter ebronensis TaxID=1462615 RepID=A0A4Q0Y8R5_9BACT|nr:PmeII family type II restriction endonuclease [Halarcobacter ebronensis]RXJ65914.1 restriction endonuclease [Halarcobacter ebronensis]